ncbi:MAG: hypothetical protein HY913_14650 [Desulfomonile tiedjei]|nr:hypothetical protein [Desulfomonile tiedjei]
MGPTFMGICIGGPMGPGIGCMLAKACKDHAAISSAAMVRTGAMRFLVMNLSFNHYSGNRLAQEVLAVPYEFR